MNTKQVYNNEKRSLGDIFIHKLLTGWQQAERIGLVRVIPVILGRRFMEKVREM